MYVFIKSSKNKGVNLISMLATYLTPSLSFSFLLFSTSSPTRLRRPISSSTLFHAKKL